MDYIVVVLGLVAIVCVLLPCKYAPTIRTKVWTENWRGRGLGRYRKNAAPERYWLLDLARILRRRQ
jgi:hypothetical protein